MASTDVLHKRVRVFGLKSRADLNGRLGEATDYLEAQGRYSVTLDAVEGNNMVIALKAANLAPEGTSGFDTPAPAPGLFGLPDWISSRIPAAVAQPLAGYVPMVYQRMDSMGVPRTLAPLAFAAPTVLLLVLWYVLGPLRATVLIAAVGVLAFTQGPSFAAAGGGMPGARAVVNGLAGRLQAASGGQLTFQYATYAVFAIFVAFIAFMGSGGNGAVVPTSGAYGDAGLPSQSLVEARIEAAYAKGYKDGKAGDDWAPPTSPRGGSGSRGDRKRAQADDDDEDDEVVFGDGTSHNTASDDYLPPPPMSSGYAGNSGGRGGGMDMSKFMNIAILGYQVYQLGGRPWSAEVAIANARQLPMWRMAIFALIAGRIVGFSPF